jgi:hypothetical protein
MPSLIHVVSFLLGSAGLIIAFCYVLRTGKVVRGAFIGWGLSIVCVFIVSVVLPGFVALYDSEYSGYFPESIAVPGVMFVGWVPALLVAGVARLVKEGIVRWAQADKTRGSQEKREDKHP